MLEHVPVLSPEFHYELDDLRCRVWNLDGVRLDVGDCESTGLYLVFEIDHEQCPTLRNNVVLVTNIAERVVKLRRRETVDDVDHNLQGVRQVLGLLLGTKVRRECPIEKLLRLVVFLVLDRETSLDQ